MCLRDTKNVESGSGDAFISLPDEILAKILSFLPTKRAASTSLISKRWRHLFPLMNHLFASQHRLDLDDSDLVYPDEGKRERRIAAHWSFRNRKIASHHHSFRNFVEKTLSGSKTIKKLSLNCQYGVLSCDIIDQWLRKALERGVVDLDLLSTECTLRCFLLVQYLRNCPYITYSVTSEMVMYATHVRVPCFTNLVKLSIESNTIKGWKLLRLILHKSRKLETLVLKGLRCVRNKRGVYVDRNKVKVLQIYGFGGSCSEFRQVDCFLGQMQFLQVMKVELDADEKDKPRLMNQLLDLKCQIQLLKKQRKRMFMSEAKAGRGACLVWLHTSHLLSRRVCKTGKSVCNGCGEEWAIGSMCLRDTKNVESGSGDAFISLPDGILAKILSFLPTKRAASTSLLSKRWRDLFPLMNHLFCISTPSRFR
ncbi:unnamed protein product [Thlaspi arvense]|uniref:F-box domain-containing protein n=1 Tax=Thlaspi arvense TaxID=13288 RepID=A0AAU9SBG1_THLAR|nr:unnamed protein product [Thlaspi arvense]